MMLQLLFDGQVAVFAMIIFTIVFSLTLHEFGHAYAAKRLGDNTAESMGRLTLNPVAHIDPMGLLMVVMVGFGWAKPVPIIPRNLNHQWGSAIVAAAGPFMNLLIAIVAANLLSIALRPGGGPLSNEGMVTLLFYVAHINLLLMLFNLIPLGPLDGHYILPRFLSTSAAVRYEQFNAQYGTMIFLGLIVLSIAGVPIFRALFQLSSTILPWITVV